MRQPWTIVRGTTPLIAAAIHDGHDINPDALPAMAIAEEERLREEDPCTGRLAHVSDTRIIVHRSRFEVDLNRPREKAVYRRPEDAWGLTVWKDAIPDEILDAALREYDRFNDDVFALLDEWRDRFGRFVIYDIHTYNHRRDGPDASPADPAGNPEVNLGTGTVDMKRCGTIVERFRAELSRQTFGGRPLDVRLDVKFKGGDFARRIHERYPDEACVLSIEFKKIFMDEWSGEVDRAALAELEGALAATVPGVVQSIQN